MSPRASITTACTLTKPIRQAGLWSWLDGMLGAAAGPGTEAGVPSPGFAPGVYPVELREQSLADAPAVPPPSINEGVHRILVAEDNVVNQRVVVRLLERLGYRVDVVTNGAEAVDAVNQQRYAAILMDCQMPGMDGYAATRAIRAREADHASNRAGRRLPIIALTANAMAADRQRCLAAGIDDYLVKPLRPPLLATTLERWLRLDLVVTHTPADATMSPSVARPSRMAV